MKKSIIGDAEVGELNTINMKAETVYKTNNKLLVRPIMLF